MFLPSQIFSCMGPQGMELYERKKRHEISQLEEICREILQDARERGPHPKRTDTFPLYVLQSEDFPSMLTLLDEWYQEALLRPNLALLDDWETVSRTLTTYITQLKEGSLSKDTTRVYACCDLTGTKQALMLIQQEKDTCTVEALLTHPRNLDSTGIKGAGTRLMQHLERLVQEHGISKVTLSALRSAVLFYARLGYAVDIDASLIPTNLEIIMQKTRGTQ